jgi:cardiolipin synthase (CMP-forming)
MAHDVVPDRYLTVPNALTVTRMALAPVVGWLIATGRFEAALYTAAGAGALDAVDGWVARTFAQTSVIGSYLDPLADKLLITCAMVGLVAAGSGGVVFVPLWLAALVVGRDALLVAGGLALRAKTKPAGVPFFSTSHSGALAVDPTPVSKANTALQLGLVCAGLTSAAWGVPAPGGLALDALGGAVAATTVVSGIGYFRRHGFRAVHGSDGRAAGGGAAGGGTGGGAGGGAAAGGGSGAGGAAGADGRGGGPGASR